MNLARLSVYNFRSIHKIEGLDVSSGLDIFIGQNDCGKTTLLHALKWFFSLDEECSFDATNQRNDLSFHATQHDTGKGALIEADEIGVVAELTLDVADLAQANSKLLPYAEGGKVTILKKCCNQNRFKGPKTAKANGYFVLASRFSNPDFNNLGKRPEKDLIALMAKYPGSNDYLENANAVGKPENPERAAALLKYAESSEAKTISFEEFPVPAKGSPDVLWPEFSLIDTKTSLDGKHKIIEDAFKKIDSEIKRQFATALEPIKQNASAEYAKITGRITAFAKKHYLTQIEEFQARPSIDLSIGSDLVMKRTGQAEFSHFDQQGDGTKRRMMVAILQVSSSVIEELGAENAEGKQTDRPYEPLKIWAFDEPEMHLHPGAQRDLFNSLAKFRDEGFQIICSTHSTVFVNSASIESVHLVELDENQSSKATSKVPEIADLIKQSIGLRNSDVFFSNIFVVVEGATEVGALPLIYESRFGSNAYTHGIAIIDGKGCSQSVEKVNFLFDNLRDVVCLFDEDARKDLGARGKELEDANAAVFIGKCDFEDAFSNEVWIKLLTEKYELKDQTGQSIWTDALLQQKRGEIADDDKNKKFLELLIREYRKKCREWAVENDGTHPYRFEKSTLGVEIAQTAIELSAIPEPIERLLVRINQRLN